MTTNNYTDLREKAEEVESLRVAMLGTEDGGFLDPDDEVPVGEMFRLASEWLIAAGYTKSPQVEGVVEWGVLTPDGRIAAMESSVEANAEMAAWNRAAFPAVATVVSRTVTPWKPEETA